MSKKPSKDPTKTLTRQAKAGAEFRRRWKAARREIVAIIEALPATEKKAGPVLALAGRFVAINKTYDFALDGSQILELNKRVKGVLAQHLKGDWLQEFVAGAYNQGAMQAAANLTPQMQLALPGFGTPAPPWTLPAYLTRVNLVKARVFESMEGVTDVVGAGLSGTLTRAILDGENPLTIAETIATLLNDELYRGERVARTEITTALRRSRLDEGQAMAAQYDMQVMFMHVSAFASTSRLEHMQRHGQTFTAEQMREWWAEDANSINCMCSMVEVLLNSESKPVAPGLIKRAKQTKQKFQYLIDEAEAA